ncbi:hypothetical protein GCM10027595_17180 [Corynebacterium nasicanis]
MHGAGGGDVGVGGNARRDQQEQKEHHEPPHARHVNVAAGTGASISTEPVDGGAGVTGLWTTPPLGLENAGQGAKVGASSVPERVR